MEVKTQIQEVLSSYSSLSYDSVNKAFYGSVKADDEDEYEVIICVYDFPQSFPLVFEVGERIPQKVDRHVYEKMGNCCFTTTAKEEILLKKEVFTLNDFLNKIVVPYFQNNSYYEINGEYKYGEHSHNIGIATHQTYSDILDIKNINLMVNILSKRLGVGYKLDKNSKCYCNSGNKIKLCKDHHKRWLDFITIDKETLKKDLGYIKKLIIELKDFESEQQEEGNGE